jgi:C4-dicarboxylate-binding protein DctP
MLYSVAIFAAPNQDQLKEKLGLGNVIVFSHVVTKDTPKGKGAEQLKELVGNGKLDNFVKIQVYPDSVLFDDTKVMQALAENKVQLAAPSISKLIKEIKDDTGKGNNEVCNPKLQIFDFPFLFSNVAEVGAFFEKAKDKIFFQKDGKLYLKSDNKQCYNGESYLVLGLWHGGMKQITSSKEIFISKSKPLEDSKFRVQSSPVIKQVFEALGAEFKLEDDFTKVYKKLKTKEIDGQENTWSNIVTGKFYEEQKYFLETNHGYLGYLLIASQSFFDDHLKNPDNEKRWQAIFDTVAGNVNQSTDNANAKESLISILQKDGKKDQPINSLNAQDREKWCERIYEGQYSEWKKLVEEIGKDIVQMAIQNKTGCPHDILRSIVNNPS